MTPCFAFTSFWPVIDPVRSSTITMSSGSAPHGEQACECTVTVTWSMPTRWRKYVGTSADSVTWTVFAGLQNFGPVTQFAVA